MISRPAFGSMITGGPLALFLVDNGKVGPAFNKVVEYLTYHGKADVGGMIASLPQ